MGLVERVSLIAGIPSKALVSVGLNSIGTVGAYLKHIVSPRER